MAFYETATARRTPMMAQVRREATVIDLENKTRIDELRRLIKRYAGDKGSWQAICAWRKELIDLYAAS